MILRRVNNAAGGAPEVADKAVAYQRITAKELSSKWDETVRQLETRGIKIVNAKNALDGALSIR